MHAQHGTWRAPAAIFATCCLVAHCGATAATAKIVPDPSSPVELVGCNDSDPRQLWDVLTHTHYGQNITQLVLSAAPTLAMACTTSYGSGGTLGSCHQWDAGDSSYDSGTIFVLNHRANASGSFPGSEFMIEAPSVGALNLRARAVPRASTWERGGRGGGSCKTVGCGTPYSSSLPCQCFRGCQKYHVCCDDYEAVCPQPPPTVLVPSANGTTVAPGAAVTLSSLASVASPRIALFSHGGDGAPIVHSASGLCLSQAVAKERAPYTLTMFHVNQGSFAGITDMDLGDAGGDALFDFRIPSQRWACIQQGGRSQFPAQCDNPEEFAPDTQLVVTKVLVQVRSGAVGAYSRCNLCPESGAIPFSPGGSRGGACPVGSTCSCKVGGYGCWPNSDAGWYGPVGALDPAKAFYVRAHAPNPAPGAYDRDTSGRWECNLANRTGGLWYSTLKEGEGKDWRLLATPKRVNATCMSRRWSNTIESKLAPACFQACPQPHNTSSTCYIECFYEGLLGPDGGRVTPAQGGLTGEQIRALWLDAFDACPAL